VHFDVYHPGEIQATATWDGKPKALANAMCKFWGLAKG
jgi:hypothetical protein